MDTWYLVHFDARGNEDDRLSMTSLYSPAEFTTLEKARKYAKEQMRWGQNVYIAEVRNIIAFDVTVNEKQIG